MIFSILNIYHHNIESLRKKKLIFLFVIINTLFIACIMDNQSFVLSILSSIKDDTHDDTIIHILTPVFHRFSNKLNKIIQQFQCILISLEVFQTVFIFFGILPFLPLSVKPSAKNHLIVGIDWKLRESIALCLHLDLYGYSLQIRNSVF